MFQLRLIEFAEQQQQQPVRVCPGLGCGGEVRVPGQVASVCVEGALLVVCLKRSNLGLAGWCWRRRRRRRLQAVHQTQKQFADPMLYQRLNILLPLVLPSAARVAGSACSRDTLDGDVDLLLALR